MSSFFPSMGRASFIRGVGDTTSKIAIVGDYTSAFDEQAPLPFQGGGGAVLERALHNAGLIRGEVYLTHLFKERSRAKVKHGDPRGPAPQWYHEAKGAFTDEGNAWVWRLREELNNIDANVIIACGNATYRALTDIQKLKDRRGYIFPSVGLDRVRQVIPSVHPASCLRGNAHMQTVLAADLAKAKQFCNNREIVRPERKLIYDFANVEECLAWLDTFIQSDKPISVDTEVLHYELASIQFSNDPSMGVFIPIADRWTLDEEVLIWRKVQQVLATPNEKILQNGIFDIQFLAVRCGLIIEGKITDTMIAHSCMLPELPKGLGFLGSLYCGAQEYWKDKADFKSIKEED